MLDSWKTQFPKVDLVKEFVLMGNWLSNPLKNKKNLDGNEFFVVKSLQTGKKN
jgi:hypothetical protein